MLLKGANMNTETLDVIKLVAQETPTAHIVFNSLARRQRFRYETNLNKMKNILLNSGEKIVEDEFRALFRKLQDYGVGAIIYGRGSNPDKFKWNYNLRDLAKAAVTGTVRAEDVKKIGHKVHKTRRRAPVLKLRPIPAKEVSLTLTLNVSAKEIESLLLMLKQRGLT